MVFEQKALRIAKLSEEGLDHEQAAQALFFTHEDFFLKLKSLGQLLIQLLAIIYEGLC